MPTTNLKQSQSSTFLLHFQYKLSETSGTAAANSAGSAAPGTYFGTPTFRVDGPGGDGGGATFPSGSGMVADPGGGYLSNGIWEYWFKVASFPSTSGQLGVISSWYDPGTHGIDNLIAVTSAGNLKVITAGSSSSFENPGTIPVSPNAWHQVLLTRDSVAGVTIYFDGALVDSMNGPTSPFGSPVLYLGSLPSDAVFQWPIGGYSLVNQTVSLDAIAEWGDPVTTPAQHAATNYGYGSTYLYQGIRVTDAVAEVLRTGGSAGRFTETVVEALRNGTPALRTTELVLEILRTSAIGAGYLTSATTGINIGSVNGTPSTAGNKEVFATTGINVGIYSPTPSALDHLIATDAHRALHYPLDDSSGPSARETNSGFNTRDGTYFGTVQYSQGGPNGAVGVQFSGGAYMEYQFGGTGTAPFPLSVEFWFKVAALPGAESALFSMDYTGGPTHPPALVTLGADGKVRFYAGTDAGTGVATTTGAVAVNTWHQVWIAVDAWSSGYPFYLWVDGHLAASGTTPSAGFQQTYNRYSIGAHSQKSPGFPTMPGLYSELAFYGSGSTSAFASVASHWATGGGLVYTKGAASGIIFDLQENHSSAHVLAKSATTTFALRHNASYPIHRFATTSIDVGQGATGNKRITKSATTSFIVGSGGSSFKAAAGVASTGLLFLPQARNPFNPNVYVTASTEIAQGTASDFDVDSTYILNAETRVTLGLSPSYKKALVVGASTGVLLVHDAYGHNTTQYGSATTSIVVGLASRGNVPHVVQAAATSAFTLAHANVVKTNFVLVTASTAVRLGLSADVEQILRAWGVHARTDFLVVSLGRRAGAFAWPVSAKTAMEIVHDAEDAIARSRRAVASTKLDLRHAARTVLSEAVFVAATTAIRLFTDADVNRFRTFRVQAQAGLTFGSTGSAVRAARAAGVTALEMGTSPPRPGRIFHVTAVTAMAMDRGEDVNEFIYETGTVSRFELHLVAALIKSGTPGVTGLAFAHRADAEVWLEWRLSPLDLDPGGQLPH